MADTYRLYLDSELLLFSKQQWIVKNIIPDTGIGVIFGDSQTYKSFVGLDLLAHIARGAPRWFRQRIKKKVACIYVPLEGRGGIPKRVHAWRQAQAQKTPVKIGGGNIGLQFLPPEHQSFDTCIQYFMEPVNLRNPIERAKFIKTLKEKGFQGCLICIDTLAQMGAGLNENSPEGMGELIKIMQEIQAELGGVVMAIHHTGKDAWRGMRGHSSLGAALDFAIECERQKNAPSKYHAQFTLDKVKDGESGLTFPFSMERIVMGKDEDGDEISSLVVIELPDAPDTLPRVVKTPAELKAEQDLLDEDFVYKAIAHRVGNNSYPTRPELVAEFKTKSPNAISRDRTYDAVERLVKKNRIVADLKNRYNIVDSK